MGDKYVRESKEWLVELDIEGFEQIDLVDKGRTKGCK